MKTSRNFSRSPRESKTVSLSSVRCSQGGCAGPRSAVCMGSPTSGLHFSILGLHRSTFGAEFYVMVHLPFIRPRVEAEIDVSFQFTCFVHNWFTTLGNLHTCYQTAWATQHIIPQLSDLPPLRWPHERGGPPWAIYRGGSVGANHLGGSSRSWVHPVLIRPYWRG